MVLLRTALNSEQCMLLSIITNHDLSLSMRRLNMELTTARSPQQQNGYDCGVYVLGANSSLLSCAISGYAQCVGT